MKRHLSIKTAALAILFSTSTAFMTAAAEPIYTVDQIVVKTSELVGKTVTVKGKCKHVCSSSGKKIFLSTEAGKLLRFNAGDKVDRFDRAALSKQVTITGVVTEHRTYMVTLEKLEAKALETEKNKVVEHCSTDAKANGEDTASTPVQRIRTQKEKLSKQIADGGKDYLATYTINSCNDYSFE
jgi:hypothetical protein